MANSPESTLQNPVNFRAPPPSPIASGRRSSFANDEVLTEFLETSLQVPDLTLPDKFFPKQKFVENPSIIDFQSLQNDSTSKILIDSVTTIGCFQLVNYGISGEVIKLVLLEAFRIFRVAPEKKAAVTRSPEKLYGFEGIHCDGENEEVSEEFLWCRDERLKKEMEGILPFEYSNFSNRLEALLQDLEKIAEKILEILQKNFSNKTIYQDGQDLVSSVCYLYKHNRNISAESSLLRYEVIKMLIRGIDISHALCLHICDGSSEFHVYSKKGWVSFSPEKNALMITVGDQTQVLSGGQYKHVIGRPIFRGEKQDSISMAVLYSPPPRSTAATVTSTMATTVCGFQERDEKTTTISLGQQALFALFLPLLYQFFVYIYNCL